MFLNLTVAQPALLGKVGEVENAVKQLKEDKIQMKNNDNGSTSNDNIKCERIKNLVGEKGMRELSEEGFQKHRGNVHILDFIIVIIIVISKYDDGGVDKVDH